jgi:hypothetical protein
LRVGEQVVEKTMKRIQCKHVPVVEVLTAVKKRQLGIDDRFPYQQLSDKYPEKVVYAKMEKLARDGLIGYGVSLRTGWITPKGQAYIDAL